MKTTINRREFISATGAGIVSLAIPAGISRSLRGALAAARDKPNIVLIMADDLGYECLSCYGSASYRTPVLDELAGTGMRFEHCYSQPLCTPSRVKIMTGRSNARNYIRFGVFDFGEKTFANMLKSTGYETCIAGKWQLMGQGKLGPYSAGFNEYCLWHMEDVYGPKESRYRNPKIIQDGKLLGILKGKYGPNVFCDYILDFIERNKTKPFLVYYPMALTHAPFEPTPDSAEWGQNTNNKRYFKVMVEYMDKTIGRIIKKLSELGLRENTLILFTADNGTPRQITSKMRDGRAPASREPSIIKGGKGLTTDAGTHVALIANWKGTTPVGRVCPDLVDFSDILPTLAEAAGAKPPANVTIDGRSFMPQLRGEKGNPRDYVFCWYQRNPGDKLRRFARDKRWKLYDNGELFDAQNDRFEKKPIRIAEGGRKAATARKKLQAVLDAM